MNPNPQIIYSWDAPLRPYIKRSPFVVRTYISIGVLLSLIAIFFGDLPLMLVILAILFIFFVFTVTPPPVIINKITQFGIETSGTTIRWDVLSHFYFARRFNYDVLILVTHEPYSHHFYIVVPDEKTKESIVKTISEHVMFQEKPVRTVTDKLVDWFSQFLISEETPQEVPSQGSQKQAHASL